MVRHLVETFWKDLHLQVCVSLRVWHCCRL